MIRLEELDGERDGRRFSPSAARNRHEISAALRGVLPEHGVILEVASGTGEHALHCATEFPGLTWQPTERDPEGLESCRAWRAHSGPANLSEPLALDLAATACWPLARADAVVAINLVHITPWTSTLALLSGAGQVLEPGGPLAIYGAFLRHDRPTAPSNLEFDARLRETDSGYGIRQLEDLVAAGEQNSLGLDRVLDLPNNNCLVVLQRRR